MGLRFQTEVHIATIAEAKRYQLDVNALPASRFPSTLPGAREVLRQDIWFERAVDPEWTVAIRLALQADDRSVVVAEVRVFPSAKPRAENSGAWRAELLGLGAPVPAGGLRARVLRQVNLRAFERHLNEIFERLGDEFRVDVRRPVPEQTKPGPPIDRRRYLQVAVVYVDAYRSGSARPTADVRRAMKIRSAATARASVATARRVGLLGPAAPGRGEKRGYLTEAALEMLQELKTVKTNRRRKK